MRVSILPWRYYSNSNIQLPIGCYGDHIDGPFADVDVGCVETAAAIGDLAMTVCISAAARSVEY